MTSQKTICKRCGTEILQITANLTEGYCMPCAKRMARAKEPVSNHIRKRNPEPILNHLHPDNDVILSVAYHPGFTPDLTSWTIQVSSDGIVHQAVQWYRKRARGEELLEPVTLEQSNLEEIQSLINSCAPEEFQSLERFACIDDIANVSLTIPARQVQVDLPYFHLEQDLRQGRLQFDDAQRAAFITFGQIWGFADRHAPYSLRKHQKDRTSRPS